MRSGIARAFTPDVTNSSENGTGKTKGGQQNIDRPGAI